MGKFNCPSEVHLWPTLYFIPFYSVKSIFRLTALWLPLFLSFSVTDAQMPGGAMPGGSMPQRQMPAVSRIYGKVLDSETRKAVEFATVTLLGVRKDTIIGGTLVRQNGDFSLEKLPFGRYRMRISFIGYKTLEKTVEITPQRMEQDLGNFRLELDAALLGTVEVEAEKATVVMSIDRKVYNVEKDISARGGTGLDVMKNLPGVSVDAEGNVSLRNGSPTVFIDGRPSTLTLEQIPSDQIDRVEIITNPSAKFDASTTGGILNVVLKKNNKPGYNGSINAGYGFFNRYNGGGNINVKEGKLNVGLSYNINSRLANTTGFNKRTSFFNDQIIGYFDQENDNQMGRTFQFGRLNVDYQLSNRSTLTLAQNIGGGKFINDDNQSFFTYDGNRTLLESGNRVNDQTNFFRNYTTQLMWRQTFPKEGKEWSADLNYSLGRNGTDANFRTLLYDGQGVLKPNQPELQINTGGGRSNVATFQFDYTDPLTPTSKLEFGVRSNYRINTSDLNVTLYDYGTGQYVPDTFLTNEYRVDDIVNAAYVTYSGAAGTYFNYQAGLRFEQTYLVAELVGKGQKFSYLYPDGFSNLGKAFFPSLYLSRKLENNREVQLNFSRKINRPGFRQITPFIFFADKQNYTIGNPALAPEFINLAEVNYSSNFDRGSFLSSVYMRYTQDVITNFVYVLPTDSSVLVSTFTNGTSQSSYGTENTLKYKLTNKLEITLNANVFYTNISASSNGINLNNSGFSWNAKINALYKFPKDFNLQLNSDYDAPRIIPQGRTLATYSTDLTLSKDIKRVWSFAVSVQDVFNTRRFGQFYETPTFTQDFSRRRDTRFLRVTASYRFGEFDVSLLKRLRKGAPAGNGMDMDF